MSDTVSITPAYPDIPALDGIDHAVDKPVDVPAGLAARVVRDGTARYTEKPKAAKSTTSKENV